MTKHTDICRSVAGMTAVRCGRGGSSPGMSEAMDGRSQAPTDVLVAGPGEDPPLPRSTINGPNTFLAW